MDLPALVSGDRPRLTQVLANLIGNAVKFTPPRGSISTSIEFANDFVEVSVQDSGRGIAEHEIATLFDRFTRSRSVVQETIGTGLGLMIVKEIIEAHNGTVGVESRLAEGSRFWFKLPRLMVST